MKTTVVKVKNGIDIKVMLGERFTETETEFTCTDEEMKAFMSVDKQTRQITNSGFDGLLYALAIAGFLELTTKEVEG